MEKHTNYWEIHPGNVFRGQSLSRSYHMIESHMMVILYLATVMSPNSKCFGDDSGLSLSVTISAQTEASTGGTLL